MKKSTFQKLIHAIRQATPLTFRQKIGPLVATSHYHYRRVLAGKKPIVLSINETLDIILEKKLSMIRFGDGEITLMDNYDLSFQKRNDTLAEHLETIITTNHEGLLICIPGIWGDLSMFENYAKSFIKHHLYRQHHIWKKLLSYETIYGDAYITRHYLGSIDKSHAQEVFNKFFMLWEERDIVLIEGSKSRIGVGNNIFSNTKSVQRILCPAEDAFLKYEKIKETALTVSKEKLILIALGPTAKVLAYELFKVGYRVIDIGHIDMEYDMFIRKEHKQIKVPYKYFNEINERDPDDCTDATYLSQIIATIN